MTKLKRFSGLFSIGIGALFLYFLIKKVGVRDVAQVFHDLGWNVLTVMWVPILWTGFHTIGWYLAVEETGAHVSFWRLVSIKLAGESINTITPVSFMGGDSVRLYMMQKKMPATLSTASIVLDRTMISLAVVPFLLLGIAIAGHTLDLPSTWKWAFPMLTVLIAILIFFFIHHQKKGLFDFLSRFLSRLGIKRHLGEELQEKLAHIDERISKFYSHNPKRFLCVLGAHSLARLCGVLEIYFIAKLLDIPLGMTGSLLLASLTILVNMVFVFIPGSLGVLEGAYGALFHVMGLDPAYGVGIQLVRRIRTIIWVFIGMCFVIPFPQQKNDALSGDRA